MPSETPDPIETAQDLKELTRRVQTLENQFSLIAVRVRKNGRIARRHNSRQDKELAYLKKVLMAVVLSFGVWSIAGDRIQSAESSNGNEDVSTLVEVLGLVLSGGVGVTAISQTQRQLDGSDKNDDEEDEPPC